MCTNTAVRIVAARQTGHRRRRWVSTALAVLGTASVAGCASASRSDTPFSERESTVRIHVINLNWSDARVYAHRSTERIRLGSVPGKGEATFNVEWTFSMPLSIEFDLLAQGRCRTAELSVDPGDVVELQIPSGTLRGPCR